MSREKIKTISTGIRSLDPIVGGGFQAGTFALLLGELGTGYDEFLITSACTLGDPKYSKTSKNMKFPEKVWWLTFMRPPLDILDEVSESFSPHFSEIFQKHVKIKDFFPHYAMATPYLPRLVMDEFTKEAQKQILPKTFEDIGRLGLSSDALLLESLADFLTKHAPNNVVIIHSLTDLVRIYRVSEEKWRSFLLFLYWIQRSARRWGGIIYTSLMKGFLEPKMEAEMLPCFDTILTFGREAHGHTQQRMLFITKFRRLSLPSGEVTKLQIKVTPQSGFEVERIRLVERLR